VSFGCLKWMIADVINVRATYAVGKGESLRTKQIITALTLRAAGADAHDHPASRPSRLRRTCSPNGPARKNPGGLVPFGDQSGERHAMSTPDPALLECATIPASARAKIDGRRIVMSATCCTPGRPLQRPCCCNTLAPMLCGGAPTTLLPVGVAAGR